MRGRRPTDGDLPAALDRIADELRSGRGLREAVVRVASKREGSSLAHLAPALMSGRLGPTLRRAAASTEDRDLGSALCVLAVHADAGGDPIPALRALADRLRGRAAARREARALTTQARMGARVILLLTPCFWLLLLAGDPGGTVSTFAHPSTRGAIALGVALQVLGGVWIAGIVGGVARAGGGLRRLPVVRAAWAMVVGRERDGSVVHLAETAETAGFLLDAGLSPRQAIALLARTVGGGVGARLRRVEVAVASGSRLHEALTDAFADTGEEAGARFADAFGVSSALGVPLAPRLRALADDLRRRTDAELSEDVRRASVRVLAPLGVFILPAFVLACLVPLLAGGLGGLTG